MKNVRGAHRWVRTGLRRCSDVIRIADRFCSNGHFASEENERGPDGIEMRRVVPFLATEMNDRIDQLVMLLFRSLAMLRLQSRAIGVDQ